MRFGLTLPNRGVLFGVTTPEQMLQMAHIADESDVFRQAALDESKRFFDTYYTMDYAPKFVDGWTAKSCRD
jgi:hypothetical protein